jgi:hypothetical protein
LNTTPGTPGTASAGGGAGSNTNQGRNNGFDNTGGGGGGVSTTLSQGNSGGIGGSGVVIARYLGAQRATGGAVTSSGGYTYHTFTGNGTFTA